MNASMMQMMMSLLLAATQERQCIVELRFPDAFAFAYAPSNGEIRAEVLIDGRGKGTVTTEGGSREHFHDIKDAITASRFAPECAGTRLRLVYEYRVEGLPDNKPNVSYRFLPPRKFLLVLRPLVPTELRTP